MRLEKDGWGTSLELSHDIHGKAVREPASHQVHLNRLLITARGRKLEGDKIQYCMSRFLVLAILI